MSKPFSNIKEGYEGSSPDTVDSNFDRLDKSRLKVLKDLARKLCETDKITLFYGLVQMKDVEIKDLQEPILSDIVLDWHVGLKSILHEVPSGHDYNQPSWYDPNFSSKLKPWVLDGYTIFTFSALVDMMPELLGRWKKVRVKLGIGCSGNDQFIITKMDDLQKCEVLTSDDITEGGIVLEPDVDHKCSYSFSRISLPNGDTIYSIGVIVMEEYDDGQQSYRGTTSIV